MLSADLPGPPHCADPHWIELPVMQFIIIQIFIYFLTLHSQLFSPSLRACTAEELDSNQITLHFKKKRKKEKEKWKENMMYKKKIPSVGSGLRLIIQVKRCLVDQRSS